MAEEFKRLDRKLVYHGTIIDYYRDTIQVPNGNIAEWDFIGHKHLDEDEFIDVYAYSVDELCEMIYSGKIEDGKTIAAIMSYKAKYEK